MFTDNIIVHVENLKRLTTNLLELINNFSKIVEYSVNIEKLITFSCIGNDQVEYKIKNTISFILTLQKKEITRYTFYKICARSYEKKNP